MPPTSVDSIYFDTSSQLSSPVGQACSFAAVNFNSGANAFTVGGSSTMTLAGGDYGSFHQHRLVGYSDQPDQSEGILSYSAALSFGLGDWFPSALLYRETRNAVLNCETTTTILTNQSNH